MPLLALKIDVDTRRGTHEGVPLLVKLLKKYNANATFLFSLGKDNTGKAIRRVFRKGFLQKVSRTSVLEHYGFRTLLYGTLLPAPDIGIKEINIMREVNKYGFEVGIHSWDHFKWQDYVVNQTEEWTRNEIKKAVDRFLMIFGKQAQTHGAAGWQMNEFAYKCEKEFNFKYASDVRGEYPFIPLNHLGYEIGIIQLPTTLPTLDELIGLNDINENNIDKHLLQLTNSPPEYGHVYTLHAELEGMRLNNVFERLLQGWINQGYKLVSLNELFSSLNNKNIPLCEVVTGKINGRSGNIALQKTIKR